MTSAHHSSCRSRIHLALFAAAIHLVVFGSHATAQTTLIAVELAADRERLYAELNDEADFFERQGNLIKMVVRLAKPTVVHIDAFKSATTSRTARRPHEEAGSGVIVTFDDKFYVLTNRHVIRDSRLDEIEVRLADGRRLNPTAQWDDPETDVGLLELAAEHLVAGRIGDSDRIDIGDVVLAVGSPFGLSHSVTSGIISARGRRDLQLGGGSIRYQDFFQTDAAINPGNSGGPLINLRGEVIGINTAIASSSGGSEGIGFAIPVNMAITVARQLVTVGRPVRAFLGVDLDRQFGPVDAARLGLPRPLGALVTTVHPNSPAQDAHVLLSDVIVEFDGTTIEDDDHLIKVVAFTPVGKEVPMVVFRKGDLVTLKVTVQQRGGGR